MQLCKMEHEPGQATHSKCHIYYCSVPRTRRRMQYGQNEFRKKRLPSSYGLEVDTELVLMQLPKFQRCRNVILLFLKMPWNF